MWTNQHVISLSLKWAVPVPTLGSVIAPCGMHPAEGPSPLLGLGEWIVWAGCFILLEIHCLAEPVPSGCQAPVHAECNRVPTFAELAVSGTRHYVHVQKRGPDWRQIWSLQRRTHLSDRGYGHWPDMGWQELSMGQKEYLKTVHQEPNVWKWIDCCS